MELLQLKYFCDAAQTCNFTKTAKKFFVPSSNISQSIHRLETELGCKLFDRGPNRIYLNRDGEMFFQRVKEALFLIDEAKNSVSDISMDGEIKICICTNRRILTDIIEVFKEKYPAVSFIIHHSYPADYTEYDLVVSDEVPRADVSATRLVSENMLLAVKSSNPISTKPDITADDLREQRFITMTPPSSMYNYTMSICESFGFVPHIAIRSDDPYYIRKYVSMGIGVAFFPEISWQGMFDDDIVCRKICDIKRDTYVFRSNKRYMPKRVKLFFDALINEKNV